MGISCAGASFCIGKDMITVEISPGEYYDRLIILDLKWNRIRDKEKVERIKREWGELNEREPKFFGDSTIFSRLLFALREANSNLWDLEEVIRKVEDGNCWKVSYIALRICKENDERSRIKNEITKLFKSEKFEDKSY